MVFPSVPAFLDPPNWNNQLHGYQQTSDREADQLPPLPQSNVEATITSRPIRPSVSVSMAERARLAKIPQPELALNCPRCNSTNTKFCYFNNYSLLQPRHFCKSCRRYWTCGGSLRNIPVGGCRRNKRSHKSVSNSPKKSSAGTTGASFSTPASEDLAAGVGGAPITNNNTKQSQVLTPFLIPEYATTVPWLGFGLGQGNIDAYQHESIGGIENLKFPNFLGGGAAQSATLSGLIPFSGGSTTVGRPLLGNVQMTRAVNSVKLESDHVERSQFGDGGGAWGADHMSSFSLSGNHQLS